jgi:hypothetical protein
LNQVMVKVGTKVRSQVWKAAELLLILITGSPKSLVFVEHGSSSAYGVVVPDMHQFG